MNYCPLISYRNEYISKMDCFGSNCMFWDDKFENCLISEYFYILTFIKIYVIIFL